MKILINIGLLLSINLFASLLTQGMNAYEKGDIKLASKLYTKGCKKGNTYSCVKLGKMYTTREGVQVNSKKARKIFSKACKK